MHDISGNGKTPAYIDHFLFQPLLRPTMKAGILTFVQDQLKTVPPVVLGDLTGKTIMVVGANAGIGLEASKYFARMKPARLILACRNEPKGRTAIEGTSHCIDGAVEATIFINIHSDRAGDWVQER